MGDVAAILGRQCRWVSTKGRTRLRTVAPGSAGA